MTENEKDEPQPGTPTRDHQENEDFDKRGQTTSDQLGESAPAGADEPEAGGEEHRADHE